ncbi:MAG: hypothetical protein KGM97_02050 [Alphaproteobacteria bacterium]|nr:hypothetical protein [Alphaproteobacteria bacterium]MDE2629749.1 hypothetical protein [Alphaproteobacteria bacterium]
MSRPVLAIFLCTLLSACASRPASPTVPLPPPPPPREPAGLIGLSARDVRGLFGTPAFVRKENGAEMWRYDGADCRLFVFLYADGGAQTVRHAETVPPGAASAADANCLTTLRAHPPVS